MGIIPLRLNRPRVGLIPTSPFVWEGQMIEPSVSVPMEAAHRCAATAAPEPDDDPHAVRSNAYGLRVKPPREDHPLTERFPRKFAHSLKLVFPKITAPALRNCFTMNASCAAI